MFLEFGRVELSIVTLHLNIMRKTVKKGLKKSCGLLEGRKQGKTFEMLSNTFNESIELIEEVDPAAAKIKIELSTEEYNMLDSFLSWYVQTLKEKAKEERLKEQNETLETLESCLTIVKGVTV